SSRARQNYWRWDKIMNADLQDDYARAGFGGRLEFGQRPALLIVDVVMAYLDPASPLYARGEAALASNRRLADTARGAGVPVIFTNVVYGPDGVEGGMFFRKVPALSAFVKGSSAGHLPPALRPETGGIVASHYS